MVNSYLKQQSANALVSIGESDLLRLHFEDGSNLKCTSLYFYIVFYVFKKIIGVWPPYAVAPHPKTNGTRNIAKHHWLSISKNIYLLGLIFSVIFMGTTIVLAQTENSITLRAVATKLTGHFVKGEFGGFKDGPRDVARFYGPTSMVFDKAGYLYVADSNNHRIRKISPDGEVSTLAGSGIGDFSDGIGINASFNMPMGLAIDSHENIYVADNSNHRIRKISPNGIVTTLAGSAFGGVDGDLNTARFWSPRDLAFDKKGNLYILDGHDKPSIRRIGVDGKVTTVYKFQNNHHPWNLTIDKEDNLWVTTNGTGEIFKISSNGVIYAAFSGGKYGYSQFNTPKGIASDRNGNIFITDSGSLYKIDFKNNFSKINIKGYSPFGGSLAIDSNGNLYISDTISGSIIKVEILGAKN